MTATAQNNQEPANVVIARIWSRAAFGIIKLLLCAAIVWWCVQLGIISTFLGLVLGAILILPFNPVPAEGRLSYSTLSDEEWEKRLNRISEKLENIAKRNWPKVEDNRKSEDFVVVHP